MSKFLFIIIIALLLSGCKKQIVAFDTGADENFELSTILDLNGKSCAYDADLKILKYAIDESSLINFSPFVEFRDISEVTFENTTLINNSINNLGTLELNTLYQVSIKTAGETNNFKLIFSNVPIVQIITHDAIINGPKTLSKMILNHPKKETLSDINWAGIELRGASSLQYDKKSFGIGIYSDPSLDNPTSKSFFDFKSDHKWILNAMYIDRSRLRNKISFDLWNSLPGSTEHVGINTEYVEVFINRKAYGVYAFSMKYTGEYLDLESESVMYEGSDNSLITTFEEQPDKNPVNSYWDGWEQKYPDPSNQIKWDDFENLSQLITESSDADFKTNIGSLIDLENVIDYYLFVNTCFANDNVGKNWFFLKRNNASKFNIVPWDLDGTWGRSPVSTPQSYTSIVTNNLFKRLEETNADNYNLKLKQRWTELRGSVFSDFNISSVINANFDELIASNIIPFENQLWPTSLNLPEEQIYMNIWASNRLIFLDTYFQ